VALVHVNYLAQPRAPYWRDLAYVAVAKLLRARVIYQVHGGELPGEFFSGAGAPRPSCAGRFAFPTSWCVLASCELEAYRSSCPNGRGGDPNGIDLPSLRAPHDRGHHTRDPLRLIYIGRMRSEKGLYEALQGIAPRARVGVDCSASRSPGGAEEARLQRYAQALGIAARVPSWARVRRRQGEADGGRRRDAAAQLLRGPALRAAGGDGRGLPVIATPVGAIPDVVTHGTHGYLVPPRDGKAIAEALALLAGDRERFAG
jgi:glycosyltransferase involved in cell wall biosynthesis